MHRHVVDPQFAATLTQLIRDHGVSQRALAARAHISRSYLSEIISGTKRPSVEIVAALDNALSAGGRLSQLVMPAGGVDDLDMIATTDSARRVSVETVNALGDVLHAQRHLDDIVGSATLIRPVLAHLDTVTGLVTQTAGRHRAGLVAVAAQWAQFSGWLHTSIGQWEQAKTWFARAMEWAVEAGDQNMIATVVSYQGHVAWLAGHIPSSTGLAAAALRDPAVYPGQRAYDAYAVARGHAALGELREATNALSVADELAAVSDTFTGEVPPWQYYRAPWFWNLEQGLVWLHISRHDRTRAADAVTALTAGISGIPGGMGGADWAGEYLTYLAAAHRRNGDIPQAQAVLDRARQIAENTQSPRITRLVEARERSLRSPGR